MVAAWLAYATAMVFAPISTETYMLMVYPAGLAYGWWAQTQWW
jgi:hypothetical protein